MIPALVAFLSAGGLLLAGALLRPLELARDVVVQADEAPEVSFGLDCVGLVD